MLVFTFRISSSGIILFYFDCCYFLYFKGYESDLFLSIWLTTKTKSFSLYFFFFFFTVEMSYNCLFKIRSAEKWHIVYRTLGFPGDSVVKNPPANAGDAGLNLELERSTGVGSGNPLQYSCLENSMDRRT